MTSSRRPSRVCALSAFLLVFATAGAASAQRTAQDISSARQLYNDGIALRDSGDMKGALEKFKAAHALGNTPITGIELCRAYSALTQPVEAQEACLSVARIPPLAEETPRSKDARNDAARLAEVEGKKIGSIRIKLTGVPAGRQATVIVDATPVAAAAVGEPRALNPGVHTIVAKVGTGPETRATLETREGETRELELAVQPPPEGDTAVTPPTEPTPTPRPREKKGNPVATGSFVVAGVGAGIGSIAGLVAISKEADLRQACLKKVCGPDHQDDLSSAKTWGNVSTTFFVLGGIALGIGIISTLTTKPSSSAGVQVTPVLGLGGGGLNGSF